MLDNYIHLALVIFLVVFGAFSVLFSRVGRFFLPDNLAKPRPTRMPAILANYLHVIFSDA